MPVFRIKRNPDETVEIFWHERLGSVSAPFAHFAARPEDIAKELKKAKPSKKVCCTPIPVAAGAAEEYLYGVVQPGDAVIQDGRLMFVLPRVEVDA